MDKILIKDLTVFAYHGVNPEEKVEGQPFVMDITCRLDLSLPCKSDNVEDTVSYAKIIKETKRVFLLQKDDLLERAAQRVTDALFEKFDKIEEITLLLKKPEAPIKAAFGFVGVEITRRRGE